MTYQKLLDMKLHEEKEVNSSLKITRVPGGWLYAEYVTDAFNEDKPEENFHLFKAPVFVPEMTY